jgi:hypothetical protein
VNIPLTEEDLAIAEQLSEQTYQKYKNFNGHYRNLRSSHSIGRYGELAAYKYFKQLDMNTNPHFLDVEQDSLCDITADNIRWDVKTWNSKYWQVWGRAVSSKQLPFLEKKADALLWTSVDPLQPSEVTIYGWSMVADIRLYEPAWMGPEGNRVHNHQVPPDKIRPLSGIKKEAPIP